MRSARGAGVRRAALTRARTSPAAPVLSSPRTSALDAPEASLALQVVSDAVPSAPGPFKVEDYVLTPALVRVRLVHARQARPRSG